MTGELLEAKDVFSKMTLDAIATSGFGIESNSFKDPNNAIRLNVNRLLRLDGVTTWENIRLGLINIISSISPKLMGILNLEMFPAGTFDYFSGLIRQILETRKTNTTAKRRNDIIDLLIDELKKGKRETKPKENQEPEDEFEKDASIDTSQLKKHEFEMEATLLSNALLLLFAGMDTTSTGLSTLVYALVKNPHVQEKLRDEINDIVGDSDKVEFHHLQEMRYTEQVINETLRYFPIVFGFSLDRKCTRDYKVPGTEFVIPKGTIVQPSCHTFGEECFSNPNEFDPDNFDPNNNPNKYGFFGWGQGPRNCIGMRYAILTIKIALVHTLRRYCNNKIANE